MAFQNHEQFDRDEGLMRGREEAQSVYLSQPIWRLTPGGVEIFPSDGGSAGPEVLPGKSPPLDSSPYNIS